MSMRSESGFTLVELLTIIGIIGVLSYLGLQSFNEYKARAAYSVALQTLRDAQTAHEAALSEVNTAFPSLPLTPEMNPGPPQNATNALLFPGFMLPRNAKFQALYDPTCETAGCLASLIQINHCLGEEYVSWSRWGDGREMLLEHIAGVGC